MTRTSHETRHEPPNPPSRGGLFLSPRYTPHKGLGCPGGDTKGHALPCSRAIQPTRACRCGDSDRRDLLSDRSRTRHARTPGPVTPGGESQ